MAGFLPQFGFTMLSFTDLDVFPLTLKSQEAKNDHYKKGNLKKMDATAVVWQASLGCTASVVCWKNQVFN